MAAPIPLDKRTIPVTNKNGLLKDAPAIHKLWSQLRRWTGYSLPPSLDDCQVAGAIDSWMNIARKTLADLSWLLRLPCYKFWSQICNDDGLHMWLGELLEVFPREHDRNSLWDPIIQQMNSNILQKLFLVHVRLCTHKESSTDFFNPDAWGNMLYDKYLLELPKILDMCVLFSPCNKAITSKMVENVFKYQNQYMADLMETGLTMEAALESASEQYQVLSISPPSISSLSNLIDLATYSLDISITLSSLVSVFPPARNSLHQTMVEVKLATFYTSVITPLVTLSHKYMTAGVIKDMEHQSLLAKLTLTRHHLVSTVREILGHVCLATTLLDTKVVHLAQVVEEFLTVFTSFLSERSFLMDYNELYPVREEFFMFDSAGAEIDVTRKHYILDALNPTQSSTFTSYTGPGPVPTSEAGAENSGGGEKSKGNFASHNSSSDHNVCGAGALVNSLSNVEIDSLVSTVRDLLPYLGEGFVERVLVEYQYKVDTAINALLENNLPPHLAELDQNMPKESKKRVASRGPSPVMRSVYDEDEFDVLTRDKVDTSKIHRGKKDKTKDAKKLLDDKSDLYGLKDRFDKLSIVVDEVNRDGIEDDGEYDDEYDDTYDDSAIGETEPDARDDLGRAFVLPVALGGGKIRPVIIDADDESDEESELKPNQNFVRNPEEVRQEQERRRAEKMHRSQKKGAPGGMGGVPPHRDVVGRARGQGQEKNVLIARARKNANKNKAQRSGADRKAAKGMF